MHIQTQSQYQICRDSYLRVLVPHEQLLCDFGDPVSPFGSRFELLFHRVVRLLVQPDLFNQSLPGTFRGPAMRFHSQDPATLRHFQYDENRQFFLSDLLDWLRLMDRLDRV